MSGAQAPLPAQPAVPRPAGPPPVPTPANDNWPKPANDNWPKSPSTRIGPNRAAARRLMGRLFGRLVPGIGAVQLAVLIWELNQRAAYAPRERGKIGPAPGEPGYVPPGYRLDKTRDTGPLFERSKVFEFNIGAGDGNTSDLWPYAPDFTTERRLGTSFYTVGIYPPAPNYTRIAQHDMVIDHALYGYTVAWKNIWVKDAAGLGSSTLQPPMPVEWYPGENAWPISPNAVPSIAPMVSPFFSPPGRQIMPVPQRLIRPLQRIEPGDLIERETGPSRREIRRERPRERPRDRPRERPDNRPNRRPSQREREHWQQATGVELSPNGVRQIQHVYEPAPPYAREVKLKGWTPYLMRKAIGALTEGHDAITAVHKALPKRCRKSRSWKDKDGKWHRALASSMLRDIRNCAGDINLQRAFANVVFNAIQDAAIGVSSRALDSASSRLFGTTGIQGAGTRLSRAEAGGDNHWSAAISNVGDWFGSNIPGVSLNQFLSGAGLDVRAPTGPRWRTRRRKQRLY